MVRGFLACRKQRVTTDEASSKWIDVQSEVPKGQYWDHINRDIHKLSAGQN